MESENTSSDCRAFSDSIPILLTTLWHPISPPPIPPINSPKSQPSSSPPTSEPEITQASPKLLEDETPSLLNEDDSNLAPNDQHDQSPSTNKGKGPKVRRCRPSAGFAYSTMHYRGSPRRRWRNVRIWNACVKDKLKRFAYRRLNTSNAPLAICSSKFGKACHGLVASFEY